MDSEVVELEIEIVSPVNPGSTLSAGLDAARFLLSHAVKDSTKQQVPLQLCSFLFL